MEYAGERLMSLSFIVSPISALKVEKLVFSRKIAEI